MFASFGVAHAQNFKLLYSFQGSYSGPDGAQPHGGLIADKAANLYGTTESGGASGYGAVFELESDGTESVLYSFTFGNNGVDGYWPIGALLEDKAGNLYGATIQGGGAANCGTIFKLAPGGVETVLYAFKGGSDGCDPSGSLVADRHGNLYGSTPLGGDSSCDVGWGCGTIFKLSPDGKESVLHRFVGGSDGQTPNAPLILDNSGNLYGTTYGPNPADCYEDCGTVFKLAPDGTEAILYTFCTQRYCPDGSSPEGGLISDNAGNLYGTTSYYGANGGGTVFELAADGTETSLYSFGFYGSDGSFPLGTLVADGQGDLYGVTWSGGGRGCKGYGCGDIFKVTPGGTETVLHSFQIWTGVYPTGSLIKINGYLYGTTESGGGSSNCGTNHKRVPYGCGTVFAIKK
ncbi:MAG TPA: choice-of-anchor tandem repeat GloVer-containing protein [Rhizomicrobium sp.]|nr:choice-of-anchor tandem repeat GloVer-containing protein [Rhizomicrobium sp.]